MSPAPVCERAENGSCAAIIDAETPYGEAEADEPGRPGPAAPPSGPPANPVNRDVTISKMSCQNFPSLKGQKTTQKHTHLRGRSAVSSSLCCRSPWIHFCRPFPGLLSEPGVHHRRHRRRRGRPPAATSSAVVASPPADDVGWRRRPATRLPSRRRWFPGADGRLERGQGNVYCTRMAHTEQIRLDIWMFLVTIEILYQTPKIFKEREGRVMK